MDGKKKTGRAGECCGEKKQCGCKWQSMRSKHSTYNDQSASDCDKSDDDVQNCESADRHPQDHKKLPLASQKACGYDLRSGLKPARTSSTNSCGCSHAA